MQHHDWRPAMPHTVVCHTSDKELLDLSFVMLGQYNSLVAGKIGKLGLDSRHYSDTPGSRVKGRHCQHASWGLAGPISLSIYAYHAFGSPSFSNPIFKT
jgi:hypothetical protein